jgi:hypothetical protein
MPFLCLLKGREGIGFSPALLKSSSASTRMEGVSVSSYCPLRTAQTKPARNSNATVRLARIKMMTTLMMGLPFAIATGGCLRRMTQLHH